MSIRSHQLAWLGVAAMLLASSAHGKKRRKRSRPKPQAAAASSDASTRALARDAQFRYLDVRTRIDGVVDRRAVVAVGAHGLAPLAEAAIVGALVSAGGRIVERDALAGPVPTTSAAAAAGHDAAVENAASGSANGAAESTTSRRPAFALSSPIIEVEAPREAVRWAAPDRLLTSTLHASPHAPTAARLVSGEAPKTPVCVTLRVIDAESGRLTGTSALCGDEGMLIATHEGALAALDDSALGCRNGRRVLPLRPHAVNVDGGALTRQVLEAALDAAGCRVVDTPPASPDGARAWSYDAVGFDRIAAIRIEGWLPAAIAVRIDASVSQRAAPTILEWLTRRGLAETLIDPDIAGSRGEIATRLVRVEAVDLADGRLRARFAVEAGADVPWDIIATAVAEQLYGERDRKSWIEIHPTPPEASVRLDGRRLDDAARPIIARVAAGAHRLDLVLGGHETDARLELEVGAHQYGVVPLVVPYGSLEVSVSPPEAEILVDGVSWGPGGAKRTVAGGPHAVVARLAECGDAVETIQVQVGRTTKVSLHLPGTIVATSAPDRAEIRVDGKRVAANESVAAAYGAHSVTFSLSGFREIAATARVESCRATTVHRAFPAVLRVASDPDGAEVWLGAARLGAAPRKRTVEPGKYGLSCQWCRFGGGEQDIAVEPGQVADVKIALEGSGFRVIGGPTLGIWVVDGAPDLAAGGRLGLWANGQFGLQVWAMGRDGFSAFGGFVGAAYRALGPGPGWSTPIAVGALMIGSDPKPAISFDFQTCVSANGAFHLDPTLAIDPDGGAIVVVNAALTYGGPTWRAAP